MTRILFRQSLLFGIILFFGLLFIFYACGRGPQSAEKSQAPAKVKNAVQEAALSTVTLSPKAEERLGIDTIQAEYRKIPHTLELGGEIVAIPGNSAQVAAPFAGTVLKSLSGEFPQAGKIVKKGEGILRLLMLPPEKDILGAEEEVMVRQEEYEVAQAKADRAQQLLANKAISEKTAEETNAELARARATLNTAKARLNLLNGGDLDSAAANLSTLVLESPFDGVLQRIFVVPLQTVPPGALLFEVSKFDPLWVRVPVYIGDLAKIDHNKSASLRLLGVDLEPKSFEAKPVQGPPLSDAASASADLFFLISNTDHLFRIGQKVKVSLLQKVVENSLAVPESALLYDINGGNWIYIKMAPHVYSRRRVEVSYIVNNIVALSRGLKEGEEFLPHFKEYDFLMHWVEKPGTSLEAMDRITIRVSRELRAIPGVRNFGAHIGRAEVADEVVGPNFTELWISLEPDVDYNSTVEKIQEVVDGYPGLYRDLLTYLRERIKEVLTGASATIVIRI